MVGLHEETATVGLEDFIMFDTMARPHCKNIPTPTMTRTGTKITSGTIWTHEEEDKRSLT